MPVHRRRVYYYGHSQRARSEGWFSLSIYLSMGIMILSLIGCLPEIVPLITGWLTSESSASQPGAIPGVGDASSFATLCEILLVVSGTYTVVALFLRSTPGKG
jgi:hypothetical protein